jgi:hypothetical protein
MTESSSYRFDEFRKPDSSIREIFEHFKAVISKLSWRFLEEEWAIEGAGELVFYNWRDYSNTVPTHVVERDLNVLMSWIHRKKNVKAYGMIVLSPCTTGPAEKLVADHSDKIALIELDLTSKSGQKLDRTGSKVIHFFVKWLSETYGVKFEEITWPFKYREIVAQATARPTAQTPSQPITQQVEEADVVGEPINFRGMVYAPLNEAGVILLFARVMDDLGIIYESSPPRFPDMIGRRRVGGRWQRVRIEFEYKSSNFKEHGHDASKCDIIVCWEHDWPDCPIEVIELRDVIRKLRPY